MERTDDGRYIVVNGRKWRATDPTIPESLRKQLVRELMSARRAVKEAVDGPAERQARRRVHDAKVSLGERGRAWWDVHDTFDDERCEATARTLLRGRDVEKTICPSDVARSVASPSWRDQMAEVRQVLDGMAEVGELELRKGGKAVSDPDSVVGPVRFGRGSEFPNPT